MRTLSPLPRRAMLGVTAGVCGLALAGCSASLTASNVQSAAPASPIPTTGTPVKVGQLSDVPVGSSASGTAKGKPILIYRPSETKVLAYSAVCTHAGCTVSPQGTQFVCPCHGSTFQGSDGTVTVGPAQRPLERYAAEISDGWITVKV